MNNYTQIETAEKPKINWGLFFMTLFLGWFGADKFFYAKQWNKTWKFAAIKFLCTFIIVGIFWNIFDCIQILRKKYKFDFRDYFE